MRLLAIFSLGCALAFAFSCSSPVTCAQEFPTISGTGEVTNVRDRHAYVRDAAGNNFVLDFNNERIAFGNVIQGIPAPYFTVVGAVDPSVVRAGMMVRVSGKLRESAELVDPILHLIITSGDVDPAGNYGLLDAPTVLLTDEDVEQGLVAHTVAGQVMRVQGGVISIGVPNPNGGRPLVVQGTADPDVLVELDSTDFGLIRPGDLVEFTGVPAGGAAAAGQHVFATQATFTKPAPADE